MKLKSFHAPSSSTFSCENDYCGDYYGDLSVISVTLWGLTTERTRIRLGVCCKNSNRSVEHLTVSFLVSAQNGMAAYGAISFVLSIINRIASNLSPLTLSLLNFTDIQSPLVVVPSLANLTSLFFQSLLQRHYDLSKTWLVDSSGGTVQ